MIIKKTGVDVHDEKSCLECFESEHDILLKQIESKFMGFMNSWIESPAGTVYKEMIETSRYTFWSRH
jgi:hypothetical protein